MAQQSRACLCVDDLAPRDNHAAHMRSVTKLNWCRERRSEFDIDASASVASLAIPDRRTEHLLLTHQRIPGQGICRQRPAVDPVRLRARIDLLALNGQGVGRHAAGDRPTQLGQGVGCAERTRTLQAEGQRRSGSGLGEGQGVEALSARVDRPDSHAHRDGVVEAGDRGCRPRDQPVAARRPGAPSGRVVGRVAHVVAGDCSSARVGGRCPRNLDPPIARFECRWPGSVGFAVVARGAPRLDRRPGTGAVGVPGPHPQLVARVEAQPRDHRRLRKAAMAGIRPSRRSALPVLHLVAGDRRAAVLARRVPVDPQPLVQRCDRVHRGTRRQAALGADGAGARPDRRS